MVDILQNMDQEDQAALEVAKTHVQENQTPTKPKRRRCVDGRYKSDSEAEEMGTTARPGADMGYVEILMALKNQGKINLTPQEIVDRVVVGVESLNEKATMHTDHHTPIEPNKPVIGCGHLAKATLPDLATKYGVNPEDMGKAIVYMKLLAQQGRIKNIDLSGDHQEQGVLIVTGVNKTVNPRSKEGKQYFVYDKTRDDQFIEKLVPRLGIPGLTVEEFKAVSDQQLNATVGILAAGLPIFTVNLDSPQPDVQFSSRVPKNT